MTEGVAASQQPLALYIHPAKQAVDLYDTPVRRRFGRPYGLIPMGVPALMNLLQDNGIPVRGINFPMEKRIDLDFSLADWLSSNQQAKMVLIDLHWYEHSYGAINVAEFVKRVLPDVWVVVGGLTASAFASEIIRDYPAVDFVLRGDAEVPLLALAKALLAGIRPVIVRIWRTCPTSHIGVVGRWWRTCGRTAQRQRTSPSTTSSTWIGWITRTTTSCTNTW